MTSLTHPKYRPDIDGLRAVAVLSVVLFHAFPDGLPGGFIGVDVFFVISGYLISTIIFENLDRGTFSFAEFYARRIKRIFPALLLVLATSSALGLFILFPDEYLQLGKHVAAGAGFVSNIVLWNEAGYFDNAADTKPLLHLWSLGVEEQFYLIWPALLFLAWKGGFNLLKTMALIAMVSFLLNIKGMPQDATASFYSPQTRFWELLSGGLLAWAVLRRKELHASAEGKACGRSANILSVLGLSLLAGGFFTISGKIGFPGVWALIPVAGAVLLISAGPGACVNSSILSHPVAVWFGLISYPLYLWHWPLLSFLRILEGDVAGATHRAAAVAVSIILAWLTHALLEKPVRQSAHGKAVVARLAVLAVAIGCLGLSAFSTGYPAPYHWADPGFAKQLKYEFPKTAACRAIHPGIMGACYESDKKYPHTVYLIGDSHMQALTHGFKQLFDRGYLRFNVMAVGEEGCNPFLNVESIGFDGKEYGCSKVMAAAVADAGSRADVEWVILAGRHAARFEGVSYSNAELAADDELTYRYSGGLRAATSPADVFTSGLEETLGSLLASGKKVLFVHQMPELKRNPRDCLGRRFGARPEGCSQDRIVVEKRLNPYKHAVVNAVAGLSGVKEYDPMHLVCNGTKCSMLNANGGLMYRDDDHMSDMAAELIAREITDEVLQLR